jgi:hypothetical protein
VAARSGCELTEVRVDRNGIDATVRAIAGTRAKIDLQLKATTLILPDTEPYFDLEIPTYNALRSTDILAPQLLVVLALPKDASEWLIGDESALAFRRCAYWRDLFGAAEVKNTATVRIALLRTQIFDPDALRDLMARVHAKAVRGLTGI